MRASQCKGDKYEEGYISGYNDASMEFVEDLKKVHKNYMITPKLIKKWEEKLKCLI